MKSASKITQQTRRIKYVVDLSFIVVAMIIAFSVANASAQDYPQELIGYWKLDETSGTIALDELDVNNGQLMNGPMWTTGKVGNALNFDGTSNYVEISGATYPQGNTGFAFEAWMKAPAGGSTNDRLISIGQEARNEGIWVGEQAANPNHIRIGIMGGPECESSSIVFDDEWHHIVGTYDQNNLRIYIDGNIEGTCPFSNLNMLGSKITLGQHETKYDWTYFNGTMDEVAIYNRALTTDEIQQHYQNGLKGLGYFEDDVPTPAEQINDIITSVVALPVTKATKNSYLANVKKVGIFMENGMTVPAINELEAFIKKVQKDIDQGKIYAQAGNILMVKAALLIGSIQK